MQQSTDAFVAGLDPATLDDEIEAFGSPRRRGWMLRVEVSNHILSHLGEVSTLRGMKGLAGRPALTGSASRFRLQGESPQTHRQYSLVLGACP